MAVHVLLIDSNCWFEHMLLWMLKEQASKIHFDTNIRGKKTKKIFLNNITFSLVLFLSVSAVPHRYNGVGK